MTVLINRRAATLTFAALWTTLSIPAVAVAQEAAPLAWTPRGLTLGQARVLDAMAELIMPATDSPGAREAGVPQFVDQAVADYCNPTEAAAIRGGLDRADADAHAAYGAAFTALTPQQQTALLTRYDGEGRPARTPAGVGRGDTETGLSNRPAPATPVPQGPPFFPILKELVTSSYFTSQLGATKAVRYVQTPGPYRGCVPLAQIGRAWAL